MTWIKTDHRFDSHGCTFYVTHKQMLLMPVAFSALQGEPDRLEAAVSELIEKFRPELKGCSVWAMGFDISLCRWTFNVQHPSLPRVALFEKLPERPLDPAYESELEARDAAPPDA